MRQKHDSLELGPAMLTPRLIIYDVLHYNEGLNVSIQSGFLLGPIRPPSDLICTVEPFIESPALETFPSYTAAPTTSSSLLYLLNIAIWLCQYCYL